MVIRISILTRYSELIPTIFKLEFFKWKAAVTTLNDALAVTMVEVFDGITGTKVSFWQQLFDEDRN